MDIIRTDGGGQGRNSWPKRGCEQRYREGKHKTDSGDGVKSLWGVGREVMEDQIVKVGTHLSQDFHES